MCEDFISQMTFELSEIMDLLLQVPEDWVSPAVQKEWDQSDV